MAQDFQAIGRNPAAAFTLKMHRGEGMLLLAMNWKNGPPPDDFVGFGIQYREPGGQRWFDLKNRLGFLDKAKKVDPTKLSTMLSPIQKFRWVHFPRNADLPGLFTYRVTPVFMNALDELSYGLAQEAELALARDTYPGQLNVTFTRGFVSSQAFVDRYAATPGAIATLLPAKADQGLQFTPTHAKTAEALAWMGFEARREVLRVLDEAIADASAKVLAIAYDLSEPEVVGRFEKLGSRLRLIVDDDGAHGGPGSGEAQAAALISASAGAANVRRQHMGKLQHNKMIVVDGPAAKRAIGGSTNFSWRGFYVQANNAVIVEGAAAIAPFKAAFEQYWSSSSAAAFGSSGSAELQDLGLPGIDGKVTFSPHGASNALLAKIALDMEQGTTSSMFYSLAFLFQTPGVIQNAIRSVMANDDIFIYGISDRKVGGLELVKPDGNIAPMRPSALTGKNAPSPFKEEPKGGGGTRMHHKFVVIDFDKPTARVYLGSYNFSVPADTKNGENLFVFRDRRIATSYTVEALRIFDHYHFRVAREEARKKGGTLSLQRPPRAAGETAWFAEDYAKPRKIKDRELFS